MDTAPRHVLLELDGEGDLQTVYGDDDDDDRSLGGATVAYDSGDETAPYLGEDGARTASSRFWGVSWDKRGKKWRASYYDADGKDRYIGRFDDEEEAARARDQTIRDAGLEGKRNMNAVDTTGAQVPKRNRAAAVAPDPARAPTETTSKFWGVSWGKNVRRWEAYYSDANDKQRSIGRFDTQEAAAHAVNAAIRRVGLEGRRHTNPVVDGKLVPPAHKRNAPGQGRRNKRRDKRRREEPTAAAPAPPPTRARRPRRLVDYTAMEDPDGSSD